MYLVIAQHISFDELYFLHSEWATTTTTKKNIIIIIIIINTNITVCAWFGQQYVTDRLSHPIWVTLSNQHRNFPIIPKSSYGSSNIATPESHQKYQKTHAYIFVSWTHESFMWNGWEYCAWIVTVTLISPSNDYEIRKQFLVGIRKTATLREITPFRSFGRNLCVCGVCVFFTILFLLLWNRRRFTLLIIHSVFSYLTTGSILQDPCGCGTHLDRWNIPWVVLYAKLGIQ